MMGGRLRWGIIALLTMGTVLNYLSRSALSVAAPTLKTSFHMDTEHYSWIALSFQLAYTIMQTVAGLVLDALGTRTGFLLFAVGWGLAGMATALATGWPSLMFFRGLVGATEAAAIPAGSKTVAEWFPAKERPIATSTFQMGTSVGNMLAPPLVVFCILHWGWQSAFVVTGALSLVWAAAWWAFYRSPAEHKRLSPEERAYIADGQVDDGAPRPATRWEVVTSRAFWAIAIPRFLAEPAWQTFNFFIPLYLVAAWHLDLQSIALWAWLPFLAADLGSLTAGLLPPLLIARGVSVIGSRKLTMTLGALCMAGPACIGLAGSPGVAIALFCVGGFAHQTLNGALITLCADLFEPRTVGIASGMSGTVAWIGGMLFTLLIGKSADIFGYNPLFAMLVALDMVGALILWGLLMNRGAGSRRDA